MSHVGLQGAPVLTLLMERQTVAEPPVNSAAEKSDQKIFFWGGSWIAKILVLKSCASILPDSNKRNFQSVPVLRDKSASI